MFSLGKGIDLFVPVVWMGWCGPSAHFFARLEKFESSSTSISATLEPPRDIVAGQCNVCCYFEANHTDGRTQRSSHRYLELVKLGVLVLMYVCILCFEVLRLWAILEQIINCFQQEISGPDDPNRTLRMKESKWSSAEHNMELSAAPVDVIKIHTIKIKLWPLFIHAICSWSWILKLHCE